MPDLDELLEQRLEFLVPVNKLDEARRQKLLIQAEIIALKKRSTLFEQGSKDDFTFYLLEGELELYADDSLIKRQSGDDSASFQPLAQLQPRQMSAIAKSKVQVLKIKRSLLDHLLSLDDSNASDGTPSGVEVEEVSTSGNGEWLMTLLQSDLFTRIPPSNLQKLLDNLHSVSCQQGDVIVRQGDPGDFYYVVQSGECEVIRETSNNREVILATLSPGQTFGEEALISGAHRNASVRYRLWHR